MYCNEALPRVIGLLVSVLKWLERRMEMGKHLVQSRLIDIPFLAYVICLLLLNTELHVFCTVIVKLVQLKVLNHLPLCSH